MVAAGRPRARRHLDFLEAGFLPSKFRDGPRESPNSNPCLIIQPLVHGQSGHRLDQAGLGSLEQGVWQGMSVLVTWESFCVDQTEELYPRTGWTSRGWAGPRFEPGIQSLYNETLPGCNLCLALVQSQENIVNTVLSSYHVVFYLISKTASWLDPIIRPILQINKLN